MIARLFNVPTHDENTNAMGTSTIGSSEAIMLATLAMKKRWQNRRKAEGKDYSRPNIIMNSAVQVCWEKAARYFDVEEKYVFDTEDGFRNIFSDNLTLSDTSFALRIALSLTLKRQ
jgi:glutamate decarboxylase